MSDDGLAEHPLYLPATQLSGTPFRNLIARRTIPGRIQYLAGKLREGEQHRDAVMLALEALADEMKPGIDVPVTVDECGDFDPIRTEDLPVTGKDGYGEPTPTVRELADILRALPEQFQDLPVARYCDEGVAGISYGTSYHREESTSEATAHVRLW